MQVTEQDLDVAAVHITNLMEAIADKAQADKRAKREEAEEGEMSPWVARLVALTCVFCRIVAGKEPADKVYETERSLAFKPLDPVTEGHTLVIPKCHAEFLAGVPSPDLADAIEVAAILAAEYHPTNIIQSNGRDATQTVSHVHFHVVPRRQGDKLRLPWG